MQNSSSKGQEVVGKRQNQNSNEDSCKKRKFKRDLISLTRSKSFLFKGIVGGKLANSFITTAVVHKRRNWRVPLLSKESLNCNNITCSSSWGIYARFHSKCIQVHSTHDLKSHHQKTLGFQTLKVK